jgi:hypothetical protein
VLILLQYDSRFTEFPRDEGRDPDCHGGADTAAALNKRQPQQGRKKRK